MSYICLTRFFGSVGILAEVATMRCKHVLGEETKDQWSLWAAVFLRHNKISWVLVGRVGFSFGYIQLLILCLLGGGMGSYSLGRGAR